METKAAAEAWARQIESEMDRGIFVSRAEAERTTLKEALDRYERQVTRAKKGWKQETYRIRIWRRDPLAMRSLASIHGSDLARWRDEQLKEGFAASTIRNDLNLISHLFTIAAKEWGMNGLANPIAQIRKPALPPGRDRRLQAGEEARLMKACAASRARWLASIVQIALESGMRLGEIMGLKWSDVDISRQVARLADTKNGTSREVPLSSIAARILETLPRSIDGQVFPITDEAVKKAFRGAVRRADIDDFRFHDLRHEATSRFFEKGLDIMEVAAITGHKTLTMLKRYTHLRAEDLARKLG